MRTLNYILAIALASVPFLSQITFAGSGSECEPGPEITHPELYKLHLIKKTFKCGDAELFTESACFFSTDTPHQQCRKQTIRLANSKKGITKKLQLDGKPVKKNFKESPGPVLDAVVYTAVCLESKSGKHYIFLGYACNWGHGCTEQTGEWQRLFSEEGDNLTVGRHEDIRLDLSFKKYGIPETSPGAPSISLTSTSNN
jgi:hypothetical protein